MSPVSNVNVNQNSDHRKKFAEPSAEDGYLKRMKVSLWDIEGQWKDC